MVRRVSNSDMRSGEDIAVQDAYVEAQTFRNDVLYRRKISDDDIFPARVSAICDPFKAMDDIKTALTDEQFVEFKLHYFGYFAELKEIKLSGKLLHHLLVRQCETQVRDELWFELNGKLLRFSEKEFGIITGLKFGSVANDDCGNSYLSSQYFEGSHKISIGELRSVLMNFNVAQKRSPRKLRSNSKSRKSLVHKEGVDLDKDIVRLALVYFLESGLFGHIVDTQYIDYEWLFLVYDLDAFDRIPWGNYVYRKLIKSLSRDVVKQRDDYKKKLVVNRNHGEHYNVHGFVFAFQVWIYEAIPLIGRKYGVKNGSLAPRILNWSASTKPTFDDVSSFISQINEGDIHTVLELTPDETQKHICPYFRCSGLIHKLPSLLISVVKRTSQSPHLQTDIGTSKNFVGASGFSDKDDLVDTLIEIEVIAKEHEQADNKPVCDVKTPINEPNANLEDSNFDDELHGSKGEGERHASEQFQRDSSDNVCFTDELSYATKAILKELKDQREFLFTFKMDVAERMENFNDRLDNIHTLLHEFMVSQ